MAATGTPAGSGTADGRGVPWLDRVAVLVPVKAFAEAKVRLAPALDAGARRALAQRMAEGVLRSAGHLPVAVVCDDRGVADWARRLGALVVWTPGIGLNRAVQTGVAHLAAAGAEVVVVAASDLPLATDLAPLATWPGITLVPDRRHDGTNVVVLPTSVSFTFAYGPGSFERHRVEAEATGAPVRILDHPALGWDVDDPADLSVLQSPAPSQRP